MSRKIVLYRNCRILEDKNMQVDNLKDYLATLQTKVFPNVTQTAEPQIIKNINDIDLTIKVDVDQEDYLKRSVHNQYNYAMITIDDNTANTNAYYYFIRKINWKSQKCAELELHMDVLNTFNGEYTLTNKTTIQRMHKDRFASKANRSWNQTGYLDELDIWEWSEEEPGSWRGEATFNLDSALAYENFTKDDVIFEYDQEPYSRNLWEFERDAINNTIKIVMYIQLPQPPQEPYGVFVSYKTLIRSIDYVSEDIQPVLYKKDIKQSIEDATKQLWYMVYTSDGDTDPFACYLFPQHTTALKVPNSTILNIIDVNKISESDKYYYICLPKVKADAESDEENYSYPIYGCTTSEGSTKAVYLRSYKYRKSTGGGGPLYNLPPVIVFKRNGSKVMGAIYEPDWIYTPATGYDTYMKITPIGEYDGYKIGWESEYPYRKESVLISNAAQLQQLMHNYENWNTFTFAKPSTETKILKSINEVDRTLSNIAKIIELPYAPLQFTLDSDKYIVINQDELNNWKYVPYDTSEEEEANYFTQSLRLDAITDIGYEHVQTIKTDTNPLQLFKVIKHNITAADIRDDNNESKLYHSSYYQPKFVYDSFSYNVPLENINQPSDNLNNFDIKFNVTSTVNSRFLFTFESVTYKQSTQDYDNILYVNRSNEITVANSSYLDYLRNGYNYDKKAKELQRVNYWMGFGSNIAKGAVSGALSGGGGAGAIAGAALGAVQGIAQGIILEEQQINDQEAKEAQLKAQAYSVSGADDIDLMRIYTGGNKMFYTVYECSDNMKEKVADLFYYCGYNVGLQAVPNTTSRYWFNFIQCTPVYDTDSTKAKLNKECLDELTRKYQSGVTVYHKHTTWDFDQIKENWEVALLN